MSAEASPAERAAVDALLGPPTGLWDGGPATGSDAHVAHAGFHRAAARRNELLPTLWAIQGEIGYISPGGLNYVCERLGVPPAEGYGVASFYALLATEERPPRVVHLCDDIACRNAGGLELAAELDQNLVVPSPCLGQCDRAPAAFLQIAGESDIEIAPAVTESVEAALASADGAGPTVEGSGAPQVSGRREELVLLSRVGVVDPASLDGYRRTGGYEALGRALELGPGGVVAEVKASNIRGRGGAAFPMGVKWESVAAAPEGPRYVVCNADESEPGTFKDRVLMEGDPFAVVEAMTIAGFAVAASRGYLYIRGEYPLAESRMRAAIDVARDSGLLGDRIMGSPFAFDIEVRRGAGAYICGEETALFNSIEGYRGEPRQKPPFPTQAGLFARPTVVNNVETLVNVPTIVLGGGEAFASVGTEQSTGSKLFCLSGDVAVPGVYEVDFGTTVGDLLALAGGVTGELAAVLLGGAAGSFIGPELLGLPLTFEATGEVGVALGSGVIMPFTRSTDFTDLARRIAGFFRDESCGQCVPCRVGTVRQEEALLRMETGHTLGSVADEVALIDEIAAAMRDASICGLGHTASGAVQSLIRMGLVGASP